jgi:anti-sigma-K factor RskA/cell division protein FtsB
MSPDLYISSGILELYVAGVLSPAEVKEVRAMAEAHESIREEILRIEETYLNYASVDVPPISADLFGRISAKIDELPVQPVQTQPTRNKEKPAATTNTNPDKDKLQSPKTIKLPEAKVKREGRRSTGRFYTVIAASLILFGLSALLNFYLYQQLTSAKNEVAELQSQSATLSEDYKKAKAESQQAFSQLNIYANPDYKRVTLKGLPLAAESEAYVYWNPKSEDVYLQVKNLPQPPAGKQYQLWAIDETDKPVDAGMLTSLATDISPMKKIGSAKAFAITLEPEGGSPNPTMDAMYVMGTI